MFVIAILSLLYCYSSGGGADDAGGGGCGGGDGGKGLLFKEAVEAFQLITSAFLPRAKLSIVQTTFRLIKQVRYSYFLQRSCASQEN